MKKHIVVIVSGLGEKKRLYYILTKNWEQKYKITPIVYIAGWHKKEETFDVKIKKLATFLESLIKSENTVSLIGISAGASLALNAYISLKEKGISIAKYISICGRFNFKTHWWYPLSYGVKPIPAFERSVKEIITNISLLETKDYQRITTFHSFFDEVVPKEASTLLKANSKVIPMIFHIAIYYTLLFPKQLASAVLKNTQ